MNRRLLVFFLIIGVCIISVHPALSDVILFPLFGDNAVLQRDVKIPVWGTASSREKVTVKIDKTIASSIADENGKWQVILPEHKAGGPYEIQVSGINTIIIKDIYFGDVWVAAGQSNMAMTVSSSNNAEEEIKQATNSLIREFHVLSSVANEPTQIIRGSWKVCNSNTVARFSATAYFFAKNLQPELSIPIGIINSSVGGTRIEAWMSKNAIEKIPELKAEIQLQDKSIQEYKAAVEEYNRKLEQWQEETKKAKIEGSPAPEKPMPPKSPLNPNSYSVLYNGMVAPFVKFPVKGILWYQGEANTGKNVYLYRILLSSLIDDWRNAWKQKIPFIFVQLPNMGRPVETYENNNWAVLRESQFDVLKKPETAMAVTIDIGEAGNIHPGNKQDVGKRLALAALGVVYKKKIEYSGPLYAGMNIESNKIRIRFNHVDGGLFAKESEYIQGFVIAGSDKIFVKAQAKIEGDTVLVWSDNIKEPIAVRYGWAGNPVCNLYNKAGLPTSPFRTDNW